MAFLTQTELKFKNYTSDWSQYTKFLLFTSLVILRRSATELPSVH